MYLRILIPPILVQMSLSSMHAASSSQPHPLASSAVNSPRMPSSDGFNEDQADSQAAVWKRKYLALKNTVDTQTSSKRKSG
jgi:hypothetical protein